MNSDYRILVVDDEPKVAFFFQQHLELGEKRYTAKAVNSGLEALSELKRHHYDLLITDFNMPQMDGLELLRRVREISPETKTILVTAYGTDEVWEEARRLEIGRALSKPIRIPDLLQAVRQTLLGTGEEMARGEGILALSGENYEQLAEQLELLRVDVGAELTIIADTTGRVMVYAGNTDQFEMATTLSLLGSTMAAASVLNQQLAHQEEVHLSYFEGPPHDLYAANLDKDFFLTIVQKRHEGGSRIGIVWLYTRRVIKQLAELLRDRGVDRSAVLEEGFAQSMQDELDGFFLEPDPGSTAEQDVPLVVMAQPAVVLASTSVVLYQRVNHILDQISQRTGLRIDRQIELLRRPLSIDMAKLLTQTVTTALKNTLQHASAKKVTVSLSHDSQTLRGLIVDDGVGLEKWTQPTFKSLGRLQTQYESLGGKLDIFGFPEKGTTVTIQLPLSELSLCTD